MADFQLKCGGDVLTAIPEAHGGLGSQDIDRGCDYKYQQSQYVVVFPIGFHQEIRIMFDENNSAILPQEAKQK